MARNAKYYNSDNSPVLACTHGRYSHAFKSEWFQHPPCTAEQAEWLIHSYRRRGFEVTGFYNVLREVVKHYRRGESVIKEEWVKELCQHCHGKGEASTACRGCKGKGIVLDEKRTRFHGVPVYKICGRCNGNRFSRLPTTLARRHVQKLVPDLTDYQWYKGYADVIGKLVTKCWQEEAYAEAQLRKVTR